MAKSEAVENIFLTGDEAEHRVKLLLETDWCEAHRNKKYSERYSHDIEVLLYGDKHNCDPNKYTRFTVEVKNDIMALKTGNIAVEIFNPKAGRPSGLTSTKADVWVFVLGNEIWATPTKVLKEFVDNTRPYRKIEIAGDNNATILLYRKKTILPIFIRIDDMEPKNRVAVLKEMIKV